MANRKPIIGVMGGTVCDDNFKNWSYRVGQLIAKRGAIVLCGGGAGWWLGSMAEIRRTHPQRSRNAILQQLHPAHQTLPAD